MEGRGLEVLVASERAYREELEAVPAKKRILLLEWGLLRPDRWLCIDKYQKAQDIWRGILGHCQDLDSVEWPMEALEGNTVFLGMYSPVRRCFQTSFCLTLSQILAREHKVLYMNFEHYSGLDGLAPKAGQRDLGDVLFFLTQSPERFLIRLESIIQSHGQVDYIPPMRVGSHLGMVGAKEWKRLFGLLSESGKYQYVLLDLSENLQGLLDILRLCKCVFTLTKEDGPARGKILQYEQLLQKSQYGDVLEKTQKLHLPLFRPLPREVEQYTRSDLTAYIQRLMGTWHLEEAHGFPGEKQVETGLKGQDFGGGQPFLRDG